MSAANTLAPALTVSVAMCTYNGARYLQEQLDSLLQQTRPPDELVVCDDGSSDQTLAQLEAFARVAPFPVVLRRNPKNLGYVKNFEQAMALCTQDVVFLCDHDDHWERDKIATVLREFEQEAAVGLVLHGYSHMDEHGQVRAVPGAEVGGALLSFDQLQAEVRQHSILGFMSPYPRAWCGCMMAFRRSLMAVVLPVYPGKGHDDWIMKVLAPVTETRFCPQPLIRYRLHLSNTNRRDQYERTLRRRLGRFWLKLKLALSGYSKRNFYRWILRRIAQSGLPVRQPALLQAYRRYTGLFRAK